MTQEISEKLDRAIEARLKGIILESEDFSEEADIPGLLEVADRLASIQFSEIPVADKQRKYINVNREEKLKINLGRLFKILIWPTSLSVMFLAGLNTYLNSQNSLPGSTFFTIKKMSEQAQVYTVQKNPTRLAEVQLGLLEKRLSEAQTALLQNSNSQVKSQALIELKNQTNATLPLIKDIASSGSDNSKLMQNLDNINRQLNGLSSKTQDPDEQKMSKSIASESIKMTREVKQILAAGAGDTTLSMAEASEINFNGKIKSISKDTLVVEKTTFTYNPSKLIINSVKIDSVENQLKSGTRVKIKGLKHEDGTLEALEVTTLQEKPATQTPVTSSPTEAEQPEIPQPKKQETIQGSFIIEDPRPQTKK